MDEFDEDLTALLDELAPLPAAAPAAAPVDADSFTGGGVFAPAWETQRVPPAPEHLQPQADEQPGPEPETVLEAPARAPNAGQGLVLVAVGAAVGGLVGGLWGAASGALAIGAVRNARRAGKLWGTDDQPEATKSATVALFGIGASGFSAWQAYQRKQAS